MSKPSEVLLDGERVLIVEDRYLIAATMAREVERLGGRVVGPSANLADARAAWKRDGADLAVLDVSLDGSDVFPLADELEAAGVPILFATGYDAEVLPPHWRRRPRITKPIAVRSLREELGKLLVERHSGERPGTST